MAKIYNEIEGTVGNDTLNGTKADDRIFNLQTGSDVANGGAGNDVIEGGTDNLGDTLIGGVGNDFIVAGENSDKDILNGGSGNDTYFVNHSGHTILDSAGIDTIKLSASFVDNDTVPGTTTFSIASLKNIENIDASPFAGATELIGNDAANTIKGGLGIDHMVGGKGNDTYLLNGTDDTIEELAKGGIDTIKLANTFLDEVDLVDFANVENIDASEMAIGTDLTGDALANTITGGSGADNLDGGVDAYKDVLIGGEGSDTYTIHDLKDVITEKGTSEDDVDTIKLAALFDDNAKKAEIAYTLKNTAIEVLDGSAIATGATLTGNAKTATTIIGGAGVDSLVGGTAGFDYLQGGGDADILFGGKDTLGDTLMGGDGDDTYVLVDSNDDINDTVGSNTVKLHSAYKSSSFDLGESYAYASSHITTVDASGISKAMTLTANDANSTTIQGGKGGDTIIGGSNSAFLYGNAGNDFIQGGDGSDSLFGGAGNDIIKGGLGSDVLTGDVGNDTYILDGLESGVAIVEELKGGVDTVKLETAAGGYGDTNTSASLVGFDYVENLDASAVSTGIDLTGNDSDNTITGGEGEDLINGGAGADKMIGGAGNDEYLIDNAKDSIVENKDGGIDRVTIQDYDFGKTTSFTLANNVENLDISRLSLTLTEEQETYLSTHRIAINGNASDNEIRSSNEFGSLMKILAGAGNDIVIGNAGDDSIDGGTGDDSLYGGISGHDTLVGGAGNDTYVLDGNDENTTIIEKSGIDTIKLMDGSTTTSLAGYTTIENLDASSITTLAEDNLVLTGNDLANTMISAGGSGNEELHGGLGNDTYIVNSVKDTVIEIENQGIDTIQLTADYDFGDIGSDPKSISIDDTSNTNVENIDASALSVDVELWGSDANNILKGGSGNDSIFGGKGNDTLTGGAGANNYLFSSGDGKDLITATGNMDNINIVGEISIETNDILFYTDKAGNFYMDYTDDGIGSDVITIAKDQYDSATGITVDGLGINIGSFIDQLGAYAGMSTSAISGLNLEDKTTQAADLALVWNSGGPY